MAYEKSWTEGTYDANDVKKVGQILVKKIEENNGQYIAKLFDIGKLSGYEFKDDGTLENYGGLYKAIQVAKREYNIVSINKGRSGNLYCFKEAGDKEIVYSDDLEALELIKSIIETIDLEKITSDRAIRILRLIKKIFV